VEQCLCNSLIEGIDKCCCCSALSEFCIYKCDEGVVIFGYSILNKGLILVHEIYLFHDFVTLHSSLLGLERAHQFQGHRAKLYL
jgi:hypothetical protein